MATKQVMSAFNTLNLSKDEFFRKRRKELTKQHKSAIYIYRFERSNASVRKVPLEGWVELLLVVTGIFLIVLAGTLNISQNLSIVLVYTAILCWISLFIKIIVRRRLMWKKFKQELQNKELIRLENEWLNYQTNMKF